MGAMRYHAGNGSERAGDRPVLGSKASEKSLFVLILY